MPELDVVTVVVLPEPTPSASTTLFNTTTITSPTLAPSSTDLISSWDQPPLEKAIIWSMAIGSVGGGLFIAGAVGIIILICCRRRRTRRSNDEVGDDGRQGRPLVPTRLRHISE